MDLIADMLLIFGAAGVAFYCFILSRRLTRFTNLEHGVGGAVAVLSAQVDDLTKALERARAETAESGADLRALTERAEMVSRKLELHVASLHDLPDGGSPPETASFAHAPEPRPAPTAATAATPSFFATKRSTKEVA